MRNTEAKRLSREWGQRVRERRHAQSATQDEIARRIGRDQSWVSRYERGEVTFSVDVMLAFARALSERPEVLFPWPSESDRHSRSASSRNSSGTTLCPPSATDA